MNPAEKDAAGREALARAAEAGVHRIPVPTPYSVGNINTYLIEDDPLTLVDTGPNWGISLDVLASGIEALGHALGDIDLILLSHQHADHFGLADIVARRSGAEVGALEMLVPWFADYGEQSTAENAFGESVMKAHGVPDEMSSILPMIAAAYRCLGLAVPVTRTLRAGEEIRLRDRTLEVSHRPGHSPGDTIFHDRASGILLSADHLIGHISSNPLLMRPLTSPDRERVDGALERPHQLMKYIASMQETQAMADVSLVLPGHGAPVTGPVKLIDDRLHGHERRKEKIFRLLEQEPHTAHSVAKSMWGSIAITQAYLTLSEVLGHMDLLVDEGRVTEAVEHGVVVFTAA